MNQAGKKINIILFFYFKRTRKRRRWQSGESMLRSKKAHEMRIPLHDP